MKSPNNIIMMQRCTKENDLINGLFVLMTSVKLEL